jgi:hypothetical protein
MNLFFCGFFYDAVGVEIVQYWLMGWLMIWKGFKPMRSWLIRTTILVILVLHRTNWGNLRKTLVKKASFPAETRIEHLPN